MPTDVMVSCMLLWTGLLEMPANVLQRHIGANRLYVKNSAL